MPNPSMPGMGGAKTARQSVDLGHAFKRLARYCHVWLPTVAIASVLALAGAVLNLIGPGKLGEISDIIAAGIAGTVDMDAVQSIGFFLVILYALGFILNFAQGFLMANVTQYATAKMRADVSDKTDRLPLKFLDRKPTGEVLSLVSNDVDAVAQSMNMSISTLVSSLAQLVGSVIMMFATNWIMAAAGIGAAFLGMVLTSGIIKRSQPYFARQQAALGTVDDQVEEVMGGLDVVKVCNGEAGEMERFATNNAALEDAAWKSAFLSGAMMPLMIFVGNLSYVIVCIVGGLLALSGAIPFGTVVAFMLYIRLFTQPLQNISQAASSVQTMAAACERVFDFLEEPEMADESGKTARIESPRGEVDFRHVRFGYDEDVDIIHDFSAKAPAGKKVAIVGPTGAGKTTLVNLLMRFYEVGGGNVYIDGIDTASVTRENLHEQFGMVLQDTWFFQGTLRENIAFDAAGVTDERLDEVCEACGLLKWVRSLPARYDTELEPGSVSAGQRQLITIARAMVKDAPLLILDEATSSVDTRTELRVQRAMDTLMQGRTSFVIAHRLSTIRDADLILVMDHGDVVESGNHEELLSAGGAYAKLYNSQFEQAA